MDFGDQPSFYRSFPLGIMIAIVAVLSGCLDQRFELGDDMPISGSATPAFALPLASGIWTVEDALNQMDSLDWEEDALSGTAMLVQPFDLLQSPPIDLPLINEFLSETFALDASTAQGLSSLPAGSALTLNYETAWGWELPSMDAVDSLWVEEGMLSVSVSSDIPMNQSFEIVCTNLYSNGEPIVLDVELAYQGQLPIDATVTTNTVDARGLFGTTAGIEVLFDWAIVMTSVGETVPEDASISIEVTWQDVEVSGAFGKFASQTTVDFEVAQALPLSTEWNPDQLHFADPRIRLHARNSSGIPIGIEWDQFAFTTDQNTWSVGGPDIDDFPILAAATSLGSWGETTHVIDNSGTVPTLTEALELRPDSAKLWGGILLNPAGQNSNFLTTESTLEIEGLLEIPLMGWGRGLTWRDTIEGAISQELNAGIDPPLDWQDVESITVRFIASNGWPLGMEMQARFLDADAVAIDSLYASGDADAFGIPAGAVDWSVPITDASHGRVNQPTETIMDLVLTREKALALLAMDCQGIEVALTLGTPEAESDALVRFFPQDELSLKISARVDCSITVEP